ncbi:hypothetical protein E1265_08030 [Streptomyces sp. 8K308]|uniref:hypothetical protein n=1 Tax=Streptomyces sp. 8K308 TaxID=2530388 RepID=UPI00104C74D7|nr:hypothetical protein [Streptomyces sp. 8K308]TDC25020.1 hypothetical protein E1265_08030 [Streptomyces sp. 8K308]
MTTPRTALAAAGLSAIALASGVPAAHALAPAEADTFGFSLSPQTVARGGAVDLTVTGCTEFEATAESAVFDRVALGMPGETQSARTTVDADARVGAQFTVTFTCGSETGNATLTIASPTASPSPTGSTTASSTTLPTRGAQAGVGGGSRSDDSTMLLAGAGVSMAAVTATVIVIRRRATRHT